MITIGITHRVLGLGGAEQVSIDTAKRLHLMGVRVVFLACRWEKDQWECPEGAEVVLVPETRRLYTKTNINFLIREVRQRDIKLLIMASPAREIPVAIREATGCKLGFWLHMKPFGEVINRVEGKCAKARRSLLRRLDWIFFSYWRYVVFASSLKPKVLRRYLEMLTQSDYYFVLCQEYKEELIDSLDLSQYQHNKIIPLVNTIRPSDRRTPHPRKKEIVFVGRLNETQKGISMLLELWQRVADSLPDWSLKIYGSGGDEYLIHQGIKTLGLERIEVCGYTSDPMPVYQRAEILVMTSRFEGWPMVLMEAQGQGCIPMAFDVVAGIRSVIGGGNKAGVLIPPFDLDRYAEELLALCKDEERREQLRSNCYKKVEDYRPDVNDDQWRQIIQQLSSQP